jgi:hypothetical protein
MSAPITHPIINGLSGFSGLSKNNNRKIIVDFLNDVPTEIAEMYDILDKACVPSICDIVAKHMNPKFNTSVTPSALRDAIESSDDETAWLKLTQLHNSHTKVGMNFNKAMRIDSVLAKADKTGTMGYGGFWLNAYDFPTPGDLIGVNYNDNSSTLDLITKKSDIVNMGKASSAPPCSQLNPQFHWMKVTSRGFYTFSADDYYCNDADCYYCTDDECNNADCYYCTDDKCYCDDILEGGVEIEVESVDELVGTKTGTESGVWYGWIAPEKKIN